MFFCAPSRAQYDSDSDDDIPRSSQHPSSSSSSSTPGRLRVLTPQASNMATEIAMFTRELGAEESEALESVQQNEAFLKSLPELSFEVIKIHHFFRYRQQARVLRLTAEGIFNCKRGKQQKLVVTKSFQYRNVVRVVMHDTNNFTIAYDKDHDFHYRSPVAMTIVQEISSRLAVRKRVELTKQSYDFASEFQKKLTMEDEAFLARLVDPGRGDRSGSEGDASASSAAEPSGGSGESDESQQQHKQQQQPEELQDNGEQIPEEEQHMQKHRTRKAKKLQAMLGTTEEQRLSFTVDKKIFDPSTPEGTTVLNFVDNFSTLERTPSTACNSVRQFMNGMRTHILQKRGQEFETLMIEKKHESDEANSTSLSGIIERSLERAVILPLQQRGRKLEKVIYLANTQVKQDDDAMNAKLKLMTKQTQEQCGINREFISPNNWCASVTELSRMNEVETPAEKLDCLLASVKAVYYSFNYFKNRASGNSEQKKFFLAADDFLPIFIYITIQSGISSPNLNYETMMSLCDQDSLRGEGGYYLTVFNSALQVILHTDFTPPPPPEAAPAATTPSAPIPIASAGASSSPASSPAPSATPVESSDKAISSSPSSPPVATSMSSADEFEEVSL